MNKKDLYIGARVRFIANEEPFRGKTATVTDFSTFVSLEFDEVLRSGWRGSRNWDATFSAIELIEESAPVQIAFPFDEFIRGGALDV